MPYVIPEGNDEASPSPAYVPDKPTAPAPPDPIDEQIQQLIELIQGGPDGGGGQQQYFFDAADRLDRIARGEGDPAFEFEESRALGGVQDQFSRRGMGFSGASVNAANRTRQQYGGLRLQRQDAALEQSLNARSAGVETAALPVETLIAKFAAERAGAGGGGGGISVICTVLHERRDLPEDVYRADAMFGASLPRETMEGYWLWGRPLAGAMRRHRWLYDLIRPLAQAAAFQMAYLLEVRPNPHPTGSRLLRWGLPICAYLGYLRRRYALLGYSEV